MIEVVVSENGRVIDRIRFDADTLVADASDVATMHRGVMRGFGASEGIWQRVAHAAGYLASALAFSHASRRLENFAFARGLGAAPLTRQIVRMAHPEPPIEIEDDDLYRLQRDEEECETDYLARCEMLGCDRNGFVRLTRRA
ncbi:hypothetical protein M2175_004026 [Bradyrhizobium elkanii]|uniref:hypothetical protein n=1 Tax=Bradyrhizobium TaxID=374 RepID=UPI002168E61A|nr:MULTISPECIES: hypothetical protein [Bradyrhizobium]MCS3928995.1 hypothetical protein [Bradyrhizobium elkanii]MCS3969551.1 hypothetical protein [Bradyrhizobium japonicum]